MATALSEQVLRLTKYTVVLFSTKNRHYLFAHKSTTIRTSNRASENVRENKAHYGSNSCRAINI